MRDMSLDDIYRAARRLPLDEQEELIQRLQRARKDKGRETRDEIIAELQRRRAAGLFDNIQSLRNAYATEGQPNVTDEELRREIRENSTRWKQDIDEL